MKDFAFVIAPKEVTYFSGVIQNLPHELFDIYIGYPKNEKVYLGDSKDKSLRLDEFPQEIKKYIEKFIEEGFSIFSIDSDFSLNNYQKAMVQTSFFSATQTVIDWNDVKKCQIASMVHSTDGFITTAITKDKVAWAIFANERMANFPESNKFTRKNHVDIFEKVFSLPRKVRSEFAYTGPYHLGEWEQKRHTPKQQLREELEEYMQITLDQKKSVVAFIEDEYCNTRQVEQALAKLAPHVNLIVKRNVFDNLPDIPNVHFWPDKTFAPNLLRFAADFVLAGYNSGTLSTCTMLGLPVIPYYTSMVYLYDYKAGKRKNANYNIYMPKFSAQTITTDVIEQLNSPVNLMETEGVLQRIGDSKFWDHYVEQLPSVQKNIFGDYIIDGSAAKTAQLLIRAFLRESFGADTSAVLLKQQYIN